MVSSGESKEENEDLQLIVQDKRSYLGIGVLNAIENNNTKLTTVIQEWILSIKLQLIE